MSERRFRRVRPGRAAGLAAAALLSIASATAVEPSGLRGTESGGLCLVLIDFDSFYCGLCLEALLAFCRALPASLQETRVRGILLHRSASGGLGEADLVRIARKKWDGFRRANGIVFPILADPARIFARPEKAGASVALVDVQGGEVKTYFLPLKPKELADVLRFLRQ